MNGQFYSIEDYIFEDRVSASRRSGYARPTVNHLTVMNYVKLNNLKQDEFLLWERPPGRDQAYRGQEAAPTKVSLSN